MLSNPSAINNAAWTAAHNALIEIRAAQAAKGTEYLCYESYGYDILESAYLMMEKMRTMPSAEREIIMNALFDLAH